MTPLDSLVVEWRMEIRRCHQKPPEDRSAFLGVPRQFASFLGPDRETKANWVIGSQGTSGRNWPRTPGRWVASWGDGTRRQKLDEEKEPEQVTKIAWQLMSWLKTHLLLWAWIPVLRSREGLLSLAWACRSCEAERNNPIAKISQRISRKKERAQGAEEVGRGIFPSSLSLLERKWLVVS